MRRGLVSLLACGLLLAGCGSDADVAAIDPGLAGPDLAGQELVGAVSTDGLYAAAASSNGFGFDLHRAISEDRENTVTSPLSASVLLAMVAAGAAGETAEAMTEVLRLDGSRDQRFAALLADVVDTDDVTLSIANALWGDEGLPFEPDYLGFVRETFDATTRWSNRPPPTPSTTGSASTPRD